MAQKLSTKSNHRGFVHYGTPCSILRPAIDRRAPRPRPLKAQSTFRKLKGAELLPAVYAGEQYRDGRKEATNTRQKLAA